MLVTFGGTPLLTLPNDVLIHKTPLHDDFGWVCIESLYECTSAINMNRIEKCVHWLMYTDPRSMWLRCGAGGVNLDKGGLVLEFVDPLRVSVSLSSIHAFFHAS